MDKIQLIEDVRHGRMRYELRGQGPGQPEWCEYIGVIDGVTTSSTPGAPQRAAEIVQAVNTYDEHIELLESLQAALARAAEPGNLSMADRLLGAVADLKQHSAAVDQAVLQHHEWKESQ